MQIKRFEAKDMTTALRMVKEELGSDAVILSARSKRKGKGFFGSLKYAGVEVSAAIDSQLPATPKSPMRAARDPYRRFTGDRIERSRSTPQASRDKRTGLTSGAMVSKGRGGVRKKSSSREHIKAMSSLYQQILHQEVDRSIASELIEEIKRTPASEEILDGGNIKSHIGSLLEEMGVAVQRDRIRNGKQKFVVLVGATGVGKTTTIAKLAAREVSRGRRNVGLITVDNYSIAAIHQLETCARIIGIPLETATGAGELQKAVKQFKDRDIIFIDTPGINPRDRGQIQELSDCLAGLVDPQVHLVMSASTKEKDCISISKALKGIDIHHLLFTKLDESSNFGNIVNVLIHTRLPLSFLCCGRRVPNDIEAGSVQRIVDLLFEPDGQFAGDPAAARADIAKISSGSKETKSEAIPRFVANRNSDVFHLTNCKWAKRIKRANTINFADAREAEAQNFLPCRSCHPSREQGPRHSELNTEMMQSYGYR
jgi:flagellar biosynthesis protein FlhF